MKHGSIFSGIGGFDLAAEWMGWENVFHCEVNKYCRKLLHEKWPKSLSYEDITKSDFSIHRGSIDVLTGGWPCQDNSNAKQVGKGQTGLQGERSRLFYEFERAICEIRPRYVIGENVSNIITVNGGRDFNYILSSLARMGYNATWGTIRASDIGAPHNRERLYLVAYTNGIRLQTLESIWSNERKEIERKKISGLFNGTIISVGGSWGNVTPDFLRMDDDVPNRMDRIKSLGNSIVPEIAYRIFKQLK